MSEESVARRYAAALFAQAQEQGVLVEVARDLELADTSIREVPLLRNLRQPNIADDRKKSMLKAAFGTDIQPLTHNFLELLIDKRRIEDVAVIQREFHELLLAHQNVAFAVAVSARPLTPEQTVALQRALETKTGKTITLKTEVDQALLGGVLVRIGDTVYDGSVRGNLDRLREQLLARK